jgi:hypothetical protein
MNEEEDIVGNMLLTLHLTRRNRDIFLGKKVPRHCPFFLLV